MPPTLLIIDDDDHIALVLRRALKAYDTTHVRSAEDALALLAARDFDAILCDLTLPGYSGMDFHAQLLGARPELEPHLGFMTGGPVNDEMDRFVVAHDEQILAKPFELDRVRRFVARLVTPRPAQYPNI